MSDKNERSVASDGSVAAWAVMDGTKTLVGYHSCSRDKAEAWAREYGFPEVVPLYRNPPVTASEREAIGVAIQCVVAAKAQRHPEEEESHELLHKTAAILRGLFDRTK